MPVRRGRLLAPEGPETKRPNFGENAGTKRLDRSLVGLRSPVDVHVRNTIGQNMLQKRMSPSPVAVPFLARSMLRVKRMEWKMETHSGKEFKAMFELTIGPRNPWTVFDELESIQADMNRILSGQDAPRFARLVERNARSWVGLQCRPAVCSVDGWNPGGQG